MWNPSLSADESLPLHRRIRLAVREAIRAGELGPGERLPGARALAKQLGVNRLTVVKAMGALSRSGVVVAVPGRGVFVSRDPNQAAAIEPAPRPEEDRFFDAVGAGPELAPERLQQLSDAIHDTVQDGLDENRLSFAGGFPPGEALPLDLIRRTTQRLVRGPGAARLLGYGPTEGDDRLKSALTGLLAERGFELSDKHRVLVTAGAQQAIALCLQVLVTPGQAVVIESPGYLGVVAACRLRRIPMLAAPVDEGGLHPGRLERLLRDADVGAIYTVPSFQNPTGVSQGLRRRRRLLSIARRYGVPIIEDDVYADLRFGGRRPPPIAALDDASVVYVGSFSKALAPALRLGYSVAPKPLADQLRRAKETIDISTSTLVQAVTAELLLSGAYRRHLMRVRRLYRARRDAMIAALETHLPRDVRFTRPRGGMHLWCMPGASLDAEALLEQARAVGVTFAPGALFFCDGRRSAAFRLNFSSLAPALIETGVSRLAACLRAACATHGGTA